MKKIYLLSELFYPNKTSTAYIMTEIAKHLNKTQSVSVICADIRYDANYFDDGRNELEGISIIKTKGKDVNKNSLVSRLFGSLSTAIAFGQQVIKNVKPSDTVFAVTNPFMLVLTLAIIRIFKKFDYVLLVHDVFPENAIPAGVVNPKGLLYKVSKIVYDWSYAKADRLVVLGRDMKEIVMKKISNKRPVYVVENWFDEDLLYTPEFLKESYLKIPDISNKIVIGFAGNIGRVQNLNKFLEIYRKSSNPKLHLVIVGDGAMRIEVEKYSQEQSMKNVTFLGSLPRHEQSLFLNTFDYGLITLSDGMYGLGVPSKTYNLLSLGMPIIYLGDKNSELDILIEEFGLGKSFQWENVDEIVRFLDSLILPTEVQKQTIREIALNHFSSQRILEKMERVILNEN